jgi:response regulator RpfG family c-di-GMP phosphodiesterase
MINNKILFVDDEPNILQAYSRTLRRDFEIKTATSGAEGLEIASSEGPFAVVVSDMRMPEMDGVEFLSRMKRQAPLTVRVMLTGNADQQTAIDAVNKGDVYRFLNKPCQPDKMAETLNTAVEYFQLINAEKELLENTVKGSVQALSEILSLAKPDIFGRTTQYKSHMLACAELLGIEVDWQLETTAMMSLAGTVSLPDELVKKALSGNALSSEEAQQFNRHPVLGAELLGKIPRMENIAEGIKYQLKNLDGSGWPNDSVKGEAIPVASRLLHVIMTCDVLVSSGLDKNTALGKMAHEAAKFDAKIVEALATVLHSSEQSHVREVSVTQTNGNMVLATDVLTKDGRLLVCKGQQLTAAVGDRLMNFWKNGAIKEKLLVVMLASDA